MAPISSGYYTIKNSKTGYYLVSNGTDAVQSQVTVKADTGGLGDEYVDHSFLHRYEILPT